CHGFVMLGDNIYDTGPDSAQDKQFTTKIDKPYRRLKYGAPPAAGEADNRKRMPIYVSLGNHDLGGAGLESQLIQHYLDYAENRKWFVYPKEYWAKKIANVHLISIHTNPLAYKGTKTEPQGKLVKQTLANTSADWTIVFGHHPYRSNGSHGNAGAYEGVPGDLTAFGGDYREWVNTYVCDKADFLLTGHDHNRQWIDKMQELSGEVIGDGDESDTCDTHLAVSGAGAKTRGMEDRDNDLAFGKPTLGFLYMAFHEAKVEVEFVDADGNVEWSKTVTK
ncbi:MAG: metallophosphoesterase, partial [Bradymonadaceae bacterium]